MPPLPLLVLAGLLGMTVAALIDRGAARWQPPTRVDAAMGAVAVARRPVWLDWLPVVGWLWPLLTGHPSRLVAMRAVTELIGALAFTGLALTDLDPLRLLLRGALIADLLLILRVDWQYHLIHDRTIVGGVLLAFAAAGSQSTAALIGAALAGLGAAAAFFLFYLLARVLYRQAALGFGDVLLAGLIGAAVGPTAVLGTLLLGMVLASLGGLLISLLRRSLRTYFAYGAYLAVATIAALALPTQTTGLPGFF